MNNLDAIEKLFENSPKDYAESHSPEIHCSPAMFDRISDEASAKGVLSLIGQSSSFLVNVHGIEVKIVKMSQ